MSLRTSLEIALAIGFGNSLTDTAFEREKTELLDTLSRICSGQRALDINATDVEIDMGGVSQGRLLYIEADSEFQFKLDDIASDPITVRRMINPASSAADTTCAYVLITADFGSLYITNLSATAALSVKYCIVGDLA